MKITRVHILQLILIILLLCGMILFAKAGSSSLPFGSGVPSSEEVFFEAKPMTAAAIDLKKKLTKTDLSEGDLLLVETENYKVEYLISNDDFVVSVKKSPYKDSKVLAEKWFGDQGFSGFDLCLLNISFVPAKDVDEQLGPRDAVYSGCPEAEGQSAQEATPEVEY